MVTKPIADGWMLKTLWQRISLTIWVMLFFVLGLPFVSYAVPEKEHFSERQYNSFIQDKLRCDNDMHGCFDLLTVETDSAKSRQSGSLSKIIGEGYYNLSSLALLFGEGQRGYMPFPSLTMVNGYCFQPGLFTGIGLGYEYLDCSMMPIFADVKYILPERRHIPFVSLKLGGAVPLGSDELYSDYGFAEKTTVYGGILISPEFGVLFPQKGKNALLVSVGYHHQEISYENFSNRGPENLGQRTFVNFNRISFRISYLFR